jgi:hypothetical protein
MAKDTAKPKKRIAKPALFDNPLRMLRPGIDALRVNVGTIIWLVILPFLISIPFFFVIILSATFMENYTGSGIPWDTVVFTLVSLVLYAVMISTSIFTGLGLVIATLRSADGEKIKFRETFRLGRKYFWRFTGLFLSVAFVVLAGLILLVVPGVIMLKRYLLSPFYMIDQDLGVFDAMRKSADESTEIGGVWGILIALVALSIPSVIPVVGWMFALVVGVLYSCVPALRYREIQHVVAARSKKAQAAETDTAVEMALSDVPKAIANVPAKVSKPKRGAKKPSRRERLAGKTTPGR